MINIFNLDTLYTLFPKEKYYVLLCDEDFNIVFFSKTLAKLKLNIKSPIKNYFLDYDYYNQKFKFETKDNQSCFSVVKLRANNFIIPTIAFIVNQNPENIKYYFILENDKTAHEYQTDSNIEISRFSYMNALNILNCLEEIDAQIDDCDYQDLNILDFNSSLKEMSNNCLAIVRTFKNITLFTDLINNTILYSIKITNINNLIKSCIDSINTIANKLDLDDISSNCTIACISNCDNLLVDVDQSLLEIVFIEIFCNSIKFSETEKSVIVNLTGVENNVYINVTDNSIGFPEDMNDPFLPFAKQYKSNFKADLVGLGLGLSIAKDILRIFNGDISYKNLYDDNKKITGTSLTISLPISKLQYSILKLENCRFEEGYNRFSHLNLAFAGLF